MLKEFWKIDENGKIIEPVLLDPEVEEISDGLIEGWGPEKSFFEPYYDPVTMDWLEGKDPDITLNEAKEAKDRELNRATNDAILAGFDHDIDGIVYRFSFDTEAQLNYQGAERILSKGTVPTIDFTVFKDGAYARVPIDLKRMEALTIAIMMHKNRNIVKYRELLLPLVEQATTIEEVELITWDSI